MCAGGQPGHVAPNGLVAAAANTSRLGSAHGVPEPRRTNYKPIGRRTKSWIVGIRVAQLCVRVLQIVGAIGILVLMILIDNVDPLTSWVLRLTVSGASLSLSLSAVFPARGNNAG